MRRIPFTKMQGIGNDFVVLDESALESGWNDLAVAICDRHKGVGADGLLVVGASAVADLKMRMFNPDGTEDVCGNGMRCVARYAYERGLVTLRQWRMETGSGVRDITIKCNEEEIFDTATVAMGLPLFTPEGIPTLLSDPYDHNLPLPNGEAITLTVLSTGSTHAVTFVEALPDDADFFRLSPLVEQHEAFPERTSLMWCCLEGKNRLRIRIWERGLGETWGCGTGACATAVVALLHGYADSALPVVVASRGGELAIRWKEGEAISMEGPAETLFRGVYVWEG
jgi:diaminopimelate epimerase